MTAPDSMPSSGTRPGTAIAAIYRPMVCTAIGLAGNALLSAGKIVVGIWGNSAALVADGFHSIADVLSDIGVLIALKAASRPPDENHPYGHHNFETLGAILVAIFMLFTAFKIGQNAIGDILHKDFRHPEIPALVGSLLAVAAKEIMARYTFKVGRLHQSPALLANAAMHRSDAISSLAAAVGIGGAMAGWVFLDSIAALVIGLFIVRMGWDLLRENVMVLMDTMPRRELVDEIRRTAGAVAGVQEVRDVRVRQRGSWFQVDLRLAMHPDLTIEEAHELAHDAEDAIKESVEKTDRVFVHIEPGTR